MVLLLFSFDDGSKSDIKIAELLEKYRLKATFFLVTGKTNNSRLSSEDILWMAEKHEIGSHSVSHTDLTRINSSDMHRELSCSKEKLNRLLQCKDIKVQGFSYPFGSYNNKVKNQVKIEGYSYARTITPFSTRVDVDPYALKITSNLYDIKMLGSSLDIIKERDKLLWRAMISCIRESKGQIRINNITLDRIVRRDFFVSWNQFIRKVAVIAQESSVKDKMLHFFGHSPGLVNEIERFEKLLPILQDKTFECITLSEYVNMWVKPSGNQDKY